MNRKLRAYRKPSCWQQRMTRATALSLGLAVMPVMAAEFSSPGGAVQGSLDTTITLGASWRMQDRDPALISIANGGTSRDPNADDGNLNYARGERISTVLKVTHDLEARYREYGVFLRATYFHDQATRQKTDLLPAVRDEVGRDAEILDAYLRGRFSLAGRDLNLRLGRQVVNWGESTFILNGINVINPVNVSRLRLPGSELREGLLPTASLWFAQELTDAVTLEGVWLAEWQKTRIDPVGTFFSTNDFVTLGSDQAYTGFGRRNDANAPPAGPFPEDPLTPLVAPRSSDREPRSGREFGLALRAFLPDARQTELGFYFLNHHSRTPFVSGYRGGITAPAGTISQALPSGLAELLQARGLGPFPALPGCTVLDIPTFGALHTPANIGQLVPALGVATATQVSALNATNEACAQALQLGGAGSYFVEYPEDIRLLGVSFHTAGPAGVALQGEYAYRHNQPLQLPAAELLGAALGIGNVLTSQVPQLAAQVPYGTEISGYRRVKMHQVQMTGTKALPQVLGAQQGIVVAEVGFTHLNLPDGLAFAASGCHLPQPGSSTAASFGSTDTGCFATRNSWGYRLLTRLEYPGAIGAATLAPRLAFAHDVSGRSPTFNAGVQAMTFGLGFDYLQRWQGDLAYTRYSGGRKIAGVDDATLPGFPPGQEAAYASHTNPLVDRDFLSVSLSYFF